MALLVYFVALAWGTLGPDRGREIGNVARRLDAVERSVSGAPAPQGRDATVPRFFGSLDGEQLANIVLFVPFGVLVPLRFPRWRWWTVPAGSAVSGAVELAQLTIATHRTAHAGDWAWNTVGAAAGFGLWLVGHQAHRLRSRR